MTRGKLSTQFMNSSAYPKPVGMNVFLMRRAHAAKNDSRNSNVAPQVRQQPSLDAFIHRFRQVTCTYFDVPVHLHGFMNVPSSPKQIRHCGISSATAEISYRRRRLRQRRVISLAMNTTTAAPMGTIMCCVRAMTCASNYVVRHRSMTRHVAVVGSTSLDAELTDDIKHSTVWMAYTSHSRTE